MLCVNAASWLLLLSGCCCRTHLHPLPLPLAECSPIWPQPLPPPNHPLQLPHTHTHTHSPPSHPPTHQHPHTCRRSIRLMFSQPPSFRCELYSRFSWPMMRALPALYPYVALIPARVSVSVCKWFKCECE